MGSKFFLEDGLGGTTCLLHIAELYAKNQDKVVIKSESPCPYHTYSAIGEDGY